MSHNITCPGLSLQLLSPPPLHLLSLTSTMSLLPLIIVCCLPLLPLLHIFFLFYLDIFCPLPPLPVPKTATPSPVLAAISIVLINLWRSVWWLFNRKYTNFLLSFLLYCRDGTDDHRDDIPALMHSSDLVAGCVPIHLQYKHIHKEPGASALSDAAGALCHWNH